MQNEMILTELNNDDIAEVSGAVLPVAWAVGFGLAAVFGGAATFGYAAGKDRAERNNRK